MTLAIMYSREICLMHNGPMILVHCDLISVKVFNDKVAVQMSTSCFQTGFTSNILKLALLLSSMYES